MEVRAPKGQYRVIGLDPVDTLTWLTLCPLAQPEKDMGHGSQIEPWLTLTTTLLDASETDERRYASKMNLENRENRGSSYQYMGWMSERIYLRPPVTGGVFFSHSLLYNI